MRGSNLELAVFTTYFGEARGTTDYADWSPYSTKCFTSRLRTLRTDHDL
jgi:hypothetical protein